MVGSLLNRAADNPIVPQDLRRNLVISGINLFSLKNRRFRIGQAIFETTGWCQPCARLEQRLGRGTFQAVRGHGGITARVLQSSIIRLDDVLQVEPLEITDPWPLPVSTLETTHKLSRHLNPEPQRCVEEYLQANRHPVERRPLLIPVLP